MIRLTDLPIDTGRVAAYLECGAITASVSSYIAELPIPSIHGIFTGVFECAYQIGSAIRFWINFGISESPVEFGADQLENTHGSPADTNRRLVPGRLFPS